MKLLTIMPKETTKVHGKTCISERTIHNSFVVGFYLLSSCMTTIKCHIIVIYVDINKGIEACHIHSSWSHSDQKVIFSSVTNTKWSFVLLYFLYSSFSFKRYGHFIIVPFMKKKKTQCSFLKFRVERWEVYGCHAPKVTDVLICNHRNGKHKRTPLLDE